MLEPPLKAPVDGRQSETALAVARGARRLLRALGYSTLTELTLASGRRAGLSSEMTLMPINLETA